MIHVGQLRELEGRELDELKRRRENRRIMYSTETGLESLMDLLLSAGVFSTIDPDDSAQIGARNLAIGVLEDLGLLDGESIPKVLEMCIKSTPIVPDELG